MTYSRDKHDIGVTDIGADGLGSTVIGMMLAQDPKTNTRIWQPYDGKFLADQFFTGSPDQSYTDPEQEILLGQSDFRAGFGLEHFDSSDPKRYYSSIGADLRHKNMAIAGPISTAVTLPTITAVTAGNLDLETWSDASTPGTWTETLAVTRDAANQHGGTYCASTLNQPGAEGNILSQSVTWNIEYRSRTITFSCWIKTAVAAMFGVAIYDGVGRTSSSWHTGGGAYEKIQVTRVLNAAATELTLEIRQNSSPGVDRQAYLDDCTFTPPTDGKPVAFAEFNDVLYMAYGNNLTKLNGAGTAFTYVYSFPATISDLEPFTDDRLYIAIGTSNAYWYMSTAEAFTESTATVNTYQFFKTVHSATPTMWGNDGANTIRSNTNPINGGAAWSGQTTVSSSYYNITSLITQSGALYIMKEDMPYYLSSAGAVQNDLAPELASLTATTSGKNATVYKNKVYTHAGVQGLLETDGTTNTFLNPASYCTNLSDFAGQIFALAFDEEYLFLGLNNGAKVEILAGRWEDIDGTTRWVWHPFHEMTLDGIETLFVSSIYQKRLWIASTSSSDSLYYTPLPVGYGNITADANRSFLTGSYFITPYLHANFKTTQKAYIKITVVMGHSYDADIYWQAHYEKLGDTSWTLIDDFKGTLEDRTATAYIPIDSNSKKPISTMMRFKFTAVTDSTTTTPILLSYTVKAILYPEVKNLYFATIRCSNQLKNKQGLIEGFEYNAIKETLDYARSPPLKWPVKIYDIDGNEMYVKFLPLPRNIPRYVNIKDEKGREQERHYNVLMQETEVA